VTQISGWKDPLETDMRRTRNILSMCMKPCPTLQWPSTDPSRVKFYDTVVSYRKVGLIAKQTYGYVVEVSFELLGNLVRELAACYWQAFLSPPQYVNLTCRGQY